MKKIKSIRNKNKFNAIKQGKFDSKAERSYYYNNLKVREKAGEIKELHRITEGFLLQESVLHKKNGKPVKQRPITYKPDFIYKQGEGEKELVVFVEFKSIVTSKKESYTLRRKMFIKLLQKNEMFVEIIDKNGKHTINTYTR